jgi:hypothetical protein
MACAPVGESDLTIQCFVTAAWTASRDLALLQRNNKHAEAVDYYQLALATYRAACERWPGTPITLLHGARVIEDSRHLRAGA